MEDLLSFNVGVFFSFRDFLGLLHFEIIKHY